MVYRLGWLLWTLVQRGSNQAPDFRDDLAGISRFVIVGGLMVLYEIG